MKWVAFIIMMLLTFSAVASAVPCTINLNPSQKTVNVGDIFTVNLYVTIVGEADTVAVDLITWNANVLECTNITIGDLFPTYLIWLPGTIGTGQINASVLACNIPISNKSGIYSTLSFRVKSSGDTTITLHDFGVARYGLPLDTNILGGCHIIVSGSTPPSNPNPPSNPPEIPPVIPPVQPPQNNTGNNTGSNTTNNTIPPVIPSVIPPVIPPQTNNNNTNSSNYQPISNDKVKITDTGSWLPYYVALSLIAIVFVSATVALKVRIKKQRENKKERDIFDEDYIEKKEKEEAEDSSDGEEEDNIFH